MSTFWNGKAGKYAEGLNKDVPAQGPAPKNRPVLEDWRVLSNTYYNYYNNGEAFITKLRGLFNKYGVEKPNSYHQDDYKRAKLEALADAIFYAALLEKVAADREKPSKEPKPKELVAVLRDGTVVLYPKENSPNEYCMRVEFAKEDK